MNRYEKPTTHFEGRVVRGFSFKNGQVVVIFDNDDELYIEPESNPHKPSQLSLSVVRKVGGIDEDIVIIEEGYGEGDY